MLELRGRLAQLGADGAGANTCGLRARQTQGGQRAADHGVRLLRGVSCFRFVHFKSIFSWFRVLRNPPHVQPPSQSTTLSGGVQGMEVRSRTSEPGRFPDGSTTLRDRRQGLVDGGSHSSLRTSSGASNLGPPCRWLAAQSTPKQAYVSEKRWEVRHFCSGLTASSWHSMMPAKPNQFPTNMSQVLNHEKSTIFLPRSLLYSSLFAGIRLCFGI